MSPEKINRAIAEACGWKHVPRFERDVAGYWVRGNEKVINEEMPDYLNDLNAIQEAIFSLPFGDSEEVRFIMYLEEAMGGDSDHYGTIMATAAQRAEALLKTLGRWEEEIPQSFKDGMKDIEEGRVLDMDEFMKEEE